MPNYRIILLILSMLSFSNVFSKDEIKFFTEEVVLGKNETQVIPFRYKEKAKEDKTFETNSEEVEILKTAQVLKGYDIGFCRIKTKSRGNAILKIEDAQLKITVQDTLRVPNFLVGEPQIQTPIHQSFIWEEISVGVLVLNDPIQNPLEDSSVILKDQNEKLIPLLDCDSTKDTMRYYRFLLDGNQYAVGPIQLTPICKNKFGRITTGKTITINNIANKSDKIIKKECEDLIAPEKRLERWGNKNPKLGSSPEADNNMFVLNYGTDPVNVHDIDIQETGFYQFILRAKGDKAGGAYPSIGIFIDKKFDFQTSGRIIANTWHRSPIGLPMYFEKGVHQIALKFLNDFAVKDGVDRNLFLDQFDLQKIDNIHQNKLLALEVAILNNIHGSYVRDELGLQGRAKWNKEISKTPPKLNLEVNGKTLVSIFAAEPHFTLSRDQLKPGDNTIQISAQFPDDTNKVYSIAQVVKCEEIIPKNDTRYNFYEYAVLDPIWENLFENDLEFKNQYCEIALVKNAKEFTLKLPENLEGDFNACLDCRGDNKDNSFGVTLEADSEITISNNENKLATGWWRPLELAKIILKPGPKKLKIKLNTDHLKDPSQAKIWIRGFILKRNIKTDSTPPMATILYPKSNEIVNGDFMVIAKSIDDIKLDNTDLIFDGQPMRQNRNSGIGIGYYYFMVPEHLNSKGTHKLMITSRDREGNIAESQEVIYTANNNKSILSAYEKSLLLSKRFGYGADQDIMAEIILLGEDKWLAKTLMQNQDDPAIASSFQLSEVVLHNYYDFNHTPMAVIQHLTKTGNPLQARFSLWVQNHFSTWLNKVEAQRKRIESNEFFEAGVSSFKKLLYTSATSPAMIYYLDQQRSFAGQYNENYARELMELHTLGVNAGYTQEDVTQLAILLTGWMQNDAADLSGKPQRMSGQFSYDQKLADSRPLKVFGYDFKEASQSEMFDRTNQLFEMLAVHPKTAEFITKKLLLHYIGENFSKELHSELQKEFMRSGNMQNLLSIIATSKDLINSKTQPKVSTPLDFTIATMRRSEEPDSWSIHECTRNSGVGLFDRATPDGYPESNNFYADSNALLQRWRFCDRIQWHLYRNLPERLFNPETLEKEEWQKRMIQVAAMNATGKSLSEQSFNSVKNFYQTLEGQPFEKSLKLNSFISKLPEASSR